MFFDEGHFIAGLGMAKSEIFPSFPKSIPYFSHLYFAKKLPQKFFFPENLDRYAGFWTHHESKRLLTPPAAHPRAATADTSQPRIGSTA